MVNKPTSRWNGNGSVRTWATVVSTALVVAGIIATIGVYVARSEAKDIVRAHGDLPQHPVQTELNKHLVDTLKELRREVSVISGNVIRIGERQKLPMDRVEEHR